MLIIIVHMYVPTYTLCIYGATTIIMKQKVVLRNSAGDKTSVISFLIVIQIYMYMYMYMYMHTTYLVYVLHRVCGMMSSIRYYNDVTIAP